MPKSRTKTSSSSDRTHISASGPKYFSGGTGMRAIRAVGTESISFLSLR